MRDNSDYLIWCKDIIQSIDLIESYVAHISEEEFFNTMAWQDAVVRRLEVIGEAVNRLPDDLKKNNPDIAWNKAIGMRNILIHEYFNVDPGITWNSLKNDLPVFKKQIQEIIDKKVS